MNSFFTTTMPPMTPSSTPTPILQWPHFPPQPVHHRPFPSPHLLPTHPFPPPIQWNPRLQPVPFTGPTLFPRPLRQLLPNFQQNQNQGPLIFPMKPSNEASLNSLMSRVESQLSQPVYHPVRCTTAATKPDYCHQPQLNPATNIPLSTSPLPANVTPSTIPQFSTTNFQNSAPPGTLSKSCSTHTATALINYFTEPSIPTPIPRAPTSPQHRPKDRKRSKSKAKRSRRRS